MHNWTTSIGSADRRVEWRAGYGVGDPHIRQRKWCSCERFRLVNITDGNDDTAVVRPPGGRSDETYRGLSDSNAPASAPATECPDGGQYFSGKTIRQDPSPQVQLILRGYIKCQNVSRWWCLDWKQLLRLATERCSRNVQIAVARTHSLWGVGASLRPDTILRQEILRRR